MTTLDLDDARSPAILDKTAILERFENDAELLREVVELFLEDCPRRLADMRDALAHRDSQALQQAAHSIKGSVSNFNAAAAVAAALALETITQADDMTHADEACATLEREVTRLTAALATFV